MSWMAGERMKVLQNGRKQRIEALSTSVKCETWISGLNRKLEWQDLGELSRMRVSPGVVLGGCDEYS